MTNTNTKTLFIIKTGKTFPSTEKELGDFDLWTQRSFGDTDLAVGVVDLQQGAPLPDPSLCAGAVITGSHDMVSDELDWSLALEAWIRQIAPLNIPLLGICYGHQLIAKALGGHSADHPKGKEIGTVRVNTVAETAGDPVFQDLPPHFGAHTTHMQTALRLPEGARVFASNPHESHHAVRFNATMWGVQFHPEYDARIMQSYIHNQREELEASGFDIDALLREVSATPAAASVTRNFARMVSAMTQCVAKAH